MTGPVLLADWHPTVGDPTFLGWATTVAYAVAVFCCVRAAKQSRVPHEISPGDRRAWCLVAVLLLFLGINKQLDLQTWLMDFGRRISQDEGWYHRRRLVQAAFTFALAAGMCGAAFIARRSLALFGKRHRGAVVGLALLGIFVLFRAASADHVWRLGRREYDDKAWSWILEVTALILIIRAALLAQKSALTNSG